MKDLPWEIIDIDIHEKFECLYQSKRYKAFWGGRGGMKTWEICQYLVLRSSNETLNIVIGRQFWTSTDDSVKKSIESHITRLGLQDEFRILEKKIIHRITGSIIKFKGLERNIINAKGWDEVDILWIEEAQTMLAKPLEILLPSIRKSGSEIIFSFNRGSRHDPVDKMFLSKNADLSEAFVVKVGWEDNPNHPRELEIERQRCLREQPERYPHIWGGEPDDNAGKYIVLPYSKLLKCVGAHKKLKYTPSGFKFSGQDVADDGNDTNAWALRQGSLLSMCREWKVKFIHMTAAKADFLNRKHGVMKMFYDASGLGAGLKSDLSRIPKNPNDGSGPEAKKFIPFLFGGKVKGPEKYFIKHKTLKIKNKDFFFRANAQAWWNLRLRMENTLKALDGEKVDLDRCLFFDEDLENIEIILAELSQCVYDDSSGKIKVDKAPDNAKSPNLADSIIMAFANDIKKGLKAS